MFQSSRRIEGVAGPQQQTWESPRTWATSDLEPRRLQASLRRGVNKPAISWIALPCISRVPYSDAGELRGIADKARLSYLWRMYHLKRGAFCGRPSLSRADCFLKTAFAGPPAKCRGFRRGDRIPFECRDITSSWGRSCGSSRR